MYATGAGSAGRVADVCIPIFECRGALSQLLFYVLHKCIRVELCQLVDVSGLLVAATRVMAKAMMAKTEDITGRSRGQDHGLGDSNSALLIDIRSRAPVTRAKLP